MTAKQLLTEIFSRPQPGIPDEKRRLTIRQFKWLCDLVHAEVCSGQSGSGSLQTVLAGILLWTPSGPNRYLLNDNDEGQMTVTRKPNLPTSGVGHLFDVDAKGQIQCQ